MENKVALAYLYTFDPKDETLLEKQFAEFQAAGCYDITMNALCLSRILAEPVFFIRLMMLAQKYNLRFTEAHGVWGPTLGMSIGGRFPSLTPIMLETHRRAMAHCADIGCRTYTVHTGAHEHLFFGVSVETCSEWIRRALDVLIPEAEKNGLVLALENNCENPGSADALLPIFQEYSCKWFGCCYDMGHAHYLDPIPPRPNKIYPNGLKLEFCSDPLKKLYPHIVTAHVHDNDQTGDWHKLPGRGTIDWDTVMPELLRAPRLISIQAEADPKHDPFTIAELKACFDRLIKMA